MNRQDIILHSIELHAGPGLELGPLTAPIVRKSEADISYVDHASAADLKLKYADEPVVLDDIVEVDYVLGHGSLQQAVGKRRFRYVLAAHVIEHVPDTIRWLADIAAVLEPDGVLSLVIPDKRYTFDIARRPTEPPEIIDAYLEQRTRFSTQSMYDFATGYIQGVDPAEVWRRQPDFDFSHLPRRYTPEQALAMCRQNLDPHQYIDCHCYVFTPTSFFGLLRTLAGHNLLPFKVDYFFDTNENNLEFYVSLRKVANPSAAQADILASLPAFDPPPSERDLRQEVARLQNELHALTTSKAWRLTRPLRSGANQLRRLRRPRS